MCGHVIVLLVHQLARSSLDATVKMPKYDVYIY